MRRRVGGGAGGGGAAVALAADAPASAALCAVGFAAVEQAFAWKRRPEQSQYAVS